MVLSPETQETLLNMVLNATNSTASQSASPSNPSENHSDGFGPSGSGIIYGISALALTMSLGLAYFLYIKDKKRHAVPLVYSHNNLSNSNNNNYGSINNSDNNNDYSGIHYK